MIINNHKKFCERLSIDYQYQLINWYRLSSIVINCHWLSISSIVQVLVCWKNKMGCKCTSELSKGSLRVWWRFITWSNKAGDARSRCISWLSLHLAFSPFKTPHQCSAKFGGQYLERNWPWREIKELKKERRATWLKRCAHVSEGPIFCWHMMVGLIIVKLIGYIL